MQLDNLFTLFAVAMLGIVISQILDVVSSGIKPSQFEVKKWADDNAFQLLASVLCISAIIVLGEPLAVLIFGGEFKLTPLSSFLLGLGGDAVTNFFARRKQNVQNKQ